MVEPDLTSTGRRWLLTLSRMLLHLPLLCVVALCLQVIITVGEE